MNAPDAAVLALEAVGKSFRGVEDDAPAVRAVTLSAQPGTLSLLLGPSGSGKTTLLLLAAALLRPDAGRVRLFGSDVSVLSPRELQRLRAERIGFVFQSYLLLDGLTALENVALVLRFAGRRAHARARAMELLERFGIAALAGRLPANMSQGERQRVAIARAVANDPSLVLADEPTASLESRQGLAVITLLRDYARERGGCVLVATHDVRMTGEADVVYRMADGSLVAGGGQ